MPQRALLSRRQRAHAIVRAPTEPPATPVARRDRRRTDQSPGRRACRGARVGGLTSTQRGRHDGQADAAQGTREGVSSAFPQPVRRTSATSGTATPRGRWARAKREALPPVRAGTALAAAPCAHVRSPHRPRSVGAVTGAVISCAACERQVRSSDLSASWLGWLVGWSLDEAGRWWCTECQHARGRVPPIARRARAASDLCEPSRQQLDAVFERWRRIDAVAFRVLVVALALAALGLLVLPALLAVAWAN